MSAARQLLSSLCSRLAAAPVRRTIFFRAFAIWVCYVTVATLVANAAAKWQGTPRVSPHLLHGFIRTIDEAPPLARWDSIWFYGIAAEGYSGTGADSRHTPGFLPLYPLLMRGLAAVSGCDYFTAGLCVSRLALLAALYLLTLYVSDCEPDGAKNPSAAQLALLAFPTAFILVSVYSEALFVSLALATFVLARRDCSLWAATAAFAAALTRPHGIALVPALTALAWAKWRGGQRSGWLCAPPLGAAAAYAALAFYFWHTFGDPLRYLTAKREGWGARLSTPWATLDHAIGQLQESIEHPELGTLLRGLELPCFYLLIFAIGVLWIRGSVPEAVYVLFGLGVSLGSGSLWGLPRFTLVLFPVFAVVAGLHRRRIAWYSYLAAAGAVQACLLVNYVNFGAPAP